MEITIIVSFRLLSVLLGFLSLRILFIDASVSAFRSLRIEEEDLSLRQVQAITRHGARSPFMALPNQEEIWYCSMSSASIPDIEDERFDQPPVSRLYRQKYIRNREVLPGNCSQGQLTAIGYQNHLELGRKFRQKYVDTLKFLSPNLNPEEFYLRSSDSPRTISSAEAQMSGFFPPQKRSYATYMLDIFTIEKGTEDLIPDGHCPTLTKLCTAVQNTSEWQEKIASYDSLLEKLASIFGVGIEEMPLWVDLYDNLIARKYAGIPFPEGITDDMFDSICEITLWQLQTLYEDQQICRLGIGRVLEEVLLRFQASINGTVNPKWILYSAHDTTIAFLLSAMKIFQQANYWPPYAAHLLLELWQRPSDHSYFVRVIYNDIEMLLPGCSSPYCSFAIVQSTFLELIPKNWETECNLKKRHSPHGYWLNKDIELYNGVTIGDVLSSQSSVDIMNSYFC